MNNLNTTSLSELNEKEKETILMYITARQFKNAVPIEEMLIIPSIIGDWANYYNISINNIKLQDIVNNIKFKDNSQIKLNGHAMITARGDKIISKQSPFIVNKAFACEVYLKIIILEKNVDISDLNHADRHNLWKLFEKLPTNFKNSLMQCLNIVDNDIINDKIKNIAKAFINWRYIYEYYKETDALDFFFLNSLCDFLNEITSKLLLEKYNYDTNKDCR